MKRLRFVPFWRLTRWGFLCSREMAGRGCDEYHNRSLYVVIPLVGQLIFFYEPRLYPAIEHCSGYSGGHLSGTLVSGCPVCAEIVLDLVIDGYPITGRDEVESLESLSMEKVR